DGDDDIVNKRTNVVRILQDLEKLHFLEMAQKTKIKWAIEGDENSKEFLTHFKKRFEYTQESGLHLNLNFPKTITSDQLTDLECEVSKDEIKREVWDCGTDKSPGPDGFTFGFYRRNYGVICEDMLKGAYFGAKTKVFEDFLFLTNTPYPQKEIRRISANSSQENAYKQFPIRRITHLPNAISSWITIQIFGE
ncbi:hypothetical protein Tco_0139475, partial [Tanacetum coccineum]